MRTLNLVTTALRRFPVLLLCLPAAAQIVDYNREVRPILSDRCFGCHAADAPSRNIKLRLDQEDSARAAAVSGLITRRITEPVAAKRMPPPYSGLKLSQNEIDVLRRWTEQGAKWQKHWSLAPPEKSALPAVRNTTWARNAIDPFILARLDREGLDPSPEADKATLIRRVSLDLTGLPPTPAEVDSFLRDGDYDKLVDRLLSSPRYGEKMAIRWLDAARYADTNGYQTDAERVMWRWRDWVIDAFNSNKFYDVFAKEQIAGDLLPRATDEQKIATGFNRNHRGNSEGGIVPEEYLVEYAVDRVETFSTVFLGSTIGCARCHNHKYDPFTQKEFYQLFAYFNNVPEFGRYLKYGNTPPFIQAPTLDQRKKLDVLNATLANGETSLRLHEPSISEALRTWQPPKAWMIEDGLDLNRPLEGEGRFDGTRVIDAGNKGKFGYLDRFTASAWISPETITGPVFGRSELNEEGKGWGLALENGKLQVNLIVRKLDDSIRVQAEQALPPGEHHVVMSYDGSRMATGVHIYVDGKPWKLSIILDAINQDFLTTEPFRIGAGGTDGRKFKGSLRDVRIYSRELKPLEVSILAGNEPERKRMAYLETGAPENIRLAWQEVKRARRERDAFADTVPTVMVMREADPPKPANLLIRGAYDRPGELVERGVPAVFPSLPDGAPKNRLGLAEWLTDRRHPLTARVAVNRVWQSLFGTGLVKTVEDFGSQGEPPSHPELLDWLAVEFMESGWDTKALYKLIVTSATYRQSSNIRQDLTARDPENRLLARAPRLRLPADVVRDQALAVSGLLVEKIGGPSVKPYQPVGLWSELGGSDYQPDRGDALYRRSLYTFWKRTAPPPFMMNFDSALRETCVVRESRTDTPLQALNLMNDVTFVEASRALAQRVIAERPDERLTFLFRSVLARTPSASETRSLQAALARYRGHFDHNPDEGKALLANGDSPASHGPEAAAWTMLASLVLNLDEAITKE